MNKPYHERPDWILKSIVYFCENYTIDGKCLRGMKRGAIAWYKKHTHCDLMDAFCWDESPQGDDFWCDLWALQSWSSGETINDCQVWTDYEKRKIAKMPEVK